jgi:hypothetical protein
MTVPVRGKGLWEEMGFDRRPDNLWYSAVVPRVSDLVHLLWQIAHRARASPEEAHGHISVAARHSVYRRAIGAKSLRAHVEARLLPSNPWRQSPWMG